MLLGGSPAGLGVRRQSTAVLPRVRDDALGVTGRARLIPPPGDSAGCSVSVPWLYTEADDMCVLPPPGLGR